MGELNEKCAVGGAVVDNAAEELYHTLFALQHRGVEASGIVTTDNGDSLRVHREPGMVRDVYDEEIIRSLVGNLAIGHNRYSTNGSKYSHLQPVIDEDIGFALATNGNLPVTEKLERFLKLKGIRTQDLNDSEMKAKVVAQHVRAGHNLPEAIELTAPLLRGAYSSVALHDDMIVAFRDPKGIRPLELGVSENGYFVSSETYGLEAVGATHERSIRPGEMVIMTKDGIESRQFAEGEEKLDIFEFVYFARPDSMLYGERVGVVRYRSGEELAEEHGDAITDPNTLVVPIPETSIPIAEGFAKKLGLECQTSAITKNRYVGRTFMLQSQARRRQDLSMKHNFIEEFIKGRSIVLVDDSVVRLNTAKELVRKGLAAGATSVSLVLGSPPVRFPDFYGIDTPKQSELAAANMKVEDMRREIGAQYLGFLSLSRLINATRQPRERFNLSAFTGEYPIGIGHNKSDISPPVEMSYID